MDLGSAYIYSDNIYFTRAVLKIGANDFIAGLDRLRSSRDTPFEITLTKDRCFNTGNIEAKVQLADGGYGQGGVLVNPVHLASLYTVFPNCGVVLKPSLLYKENPSLEPWIQQTCSPEAAEIVGWNLTQMVNFEYGTGHKVMRSNIILAGEIGTTEIRVSKGDTSDTELDWFTIYAADNSIRTPILVVSMVEGVRNEDGSELVVERAKRILDSYLR